MKANCHYCRREFETDFPAKIVACPGCGKAIQPDLSGEIVASSDLRDLIQREHALGDVFRRELILRFDRQLKTLEVRSTELEVAPQPIVPIADPSLRPSPPASPDPFEWSPPARVRREPGPPSVWRRLGPVFAENVLFVLAAFLIVAGAIYFVTTAWTTMTGEHRLLVIVGGVQLLGGVLFAAARLFNRGGTLPELERVLTFVVALLAPIAAAAAGELLVANPVLGAITAVEILGCILFAGRALARSSGSSFGIVFALWFTVLCAWVMTAPRWSEYPAAADAGAVIFMLAATFHVVKRSLPPQGAPWVLAWRPVAALIFGAVVFAAHVAISAERLQTDPAGVLPPLGIVVAGAGAALVFLRRPGGPPLEARSPRQGTVPILAFAVAITGVAMAIGNHRALLAAALSGTFVGCVLPMRLGLPWLLLPGLMLSTVAYLYLPAPVRELATALRDRAAEGLGYAPKKLPLSFYGITFLPYALGLGLASILLKRTARHTESRLVAGWMLAVICGLTVLAFSSGTDLRAPAAVLSAQGTLLLALAFPMRRPWFAGAGALGVLAGLACALLHVETGLAMRVLGVTLGGAFAMAGAHRLQHWAGDQVGRTSARAASFAILDAVALAATATFVWCSFEWMGQGSLGRGGDLLGFSAFAVLLVALGATYAHPLGGLLASIVLGRVVETALAWSGVGVPGDFRILDFAACSALPLALIRLNRSARWRPRRPFSFRDLTLDRDIAYAVLVVQAVGFWGLSRAIDLDTWPWPLGAGTALAALVTAGAGLVTRDSALVRVAVIEFAAAGALLAGTLGRGVTGIEGTAGLGIALLTAIAAIVSAQRRWPRAAAHAGPAADTVAALLWILGCWVALHLTALDHIPDGVAAWTRASSGFLLVVALTAATAGGLVGWAFKQRESTAEFAGLLGALILVAVSPAIATLAGLPVSLRPLGLVATAILAAAIPVFRRWRVRAALVHLALALWISIAIQAPTPGHAALQFLGFGLIAACGWWLASKEPVLGSLHFLAGAVLAVSLALAERWCRLERSWQPPIVLVLASLAVLAPRVPALRVHRVAAGIIVTPILLLAVLCSCAYTIAVVLSEPPYWVFGSRTAFVASAAALVGFGFVLGARARGRWRVLAPALGLIFAVFAVAPVNILLHLGFERHWRPDVEIALLGLLAAGLVERFGAAPRFGGLSAAAAAAGMGALLLTAGEVRDPSTPATLFVVSGIPFVLWLRTRIPARLEVHAYTLLGALLSLAIYVLPESDRHPAEVLPLLAVVAAAFAAGLLLLAHRLTRSPASWVLEVIPHLDRASFVAAALAVTGVAGNVIALQDNPALVDTIALALAATALAAGVAIRRAVSKGDANGVHLAAGSWLVLHGFLATRTSYLAVLDGYHLQGLIVLAAGLVILGARARPVLREALHFHASWFPIPAIAMALREILGAAPITVQAAPALLLASAAYGFLAVRTRRAELAGASLVLANLALFALWRRQGISDPAFYGVPAGLSLLLVSEVAKSRVSRSGHLVLFVTGLASLYGSIAVQVLRVENPAHAIILFLLGLTAVFLGFVRHRNDFLVAGTAAVVLDVMAYLLRHGFEQGFVGAALLLAAGLTVLAVAVLSAARRKRLAAGVLSEPIDPVD